MIGLSRSGQRSPSCCNQGLHHHCDHDDIAIPNYGVLASLMNTSASAVRQWEAGDKQPSGPSQKLLNLLERKGLEALL